MGLIREPKGVDFTVLPWEMTEEERARVSAFIAREKLRLAKLEQRKESRAANGGKKPHS
jgi:hypothetical protein